MKHADTAVIGTTILECLLQPAGPYTAAELQIHVQGRLDRLQEDVPEDQRATVVAVRLAADEYELDVKLGMPIQILHFTTDGTCARSVGVDAERALRPHR